MTMVEQTKRVLLVDDDEDILAAEQIALQERGYEVIVAHDGAEAIIRAERDSPDLIVLDVIMPKRSGFSVLERLRQGQRREPPIIIVTANEEHRHKLFAESRGADDFLHKPFEIDQLIAKIDALLSDSSS